MRERARPDRPAAQGDRRAGRRDEDEFKGIDKEIRDIVNEAASSRRRARSPTRGALDRHAGRGLSRNAAHERAAANRDDRQGGL